MSVYVSRTRMPWTPYDELATRMAPACAEAVDDRQIAALLESDGITDSIARSRYGSPDVFELAERLCRDMPRRPARTEPQPGPWRATPHLHLLRGVLFGLPALAYLTVSDRVTGRGSAIVLVVSVLLSWSTSQGLAYLGHVRLGWGDPAGAARVLRGGLLWAALPTVGVTLVSALVLSVPAIVGLVAAGQVAYLMAATVALVLGKEWWLLLALVPGVGAGAVWLVVGGVVVRLVPFGWMPFAACAALSVLGAVAVAVVATRGAEPGLPTLAEATAAAPTALFGMCVGALLLFVPAVRSLDPGPDPVVGVGAGLAILLPLSLSMGPAEWLLYTYRAAMHRASQRSHTLAAFARRSGVALLGTAAGYLTALLVVSAIGLALVARLSHGSLPIAQAVGSAALGVALFVALLLMSFGIRLPVVAACVLALVLEAVLLVRGGSPEDVQTVAASTLSVALLVAALLALSRATRHH